MDVRKIYLDLIERRKKLIAKSALSGELNHELRQVDSAIRELQDNCKHSFKKGSCIYCDSREE